LNEALRRMRGQPEQTAKLYHRLGEVYEKLGRLDEGYRQLVEADKALPGQLMLRIALGENRFQARRWRDAATHLEGIADHVAAPNYPEEVALALAHGAMAELRQKRPERAAALHEAALRLSPSHPQTLRALADLAIERGDKLEAARSLRLVAESCGDPAEQCRLYEQIGDLHLALGNMAAAAKPTKKPWPGLKPTPWSKCLCSRRRWPHNGPRAPRAPLSRPRAGSRTSWSSPRIGPRADARSLPSRWSKATSTGRRTCSNRR